MPTIKFIRSSDNFTVTDCDLEKKVAPTVIFEFYTIETINQCVEKARHALRDEIDVVIFDTIAGDKITVPTDYFSMYPVIYTLNEK